jgi:hypothetical protein
MVMVRSALKFAVRMQKLSSEKSSIAECVSRVLSCWIRWCIFLCVVLCLRSLMMDKRSFIRPPLWNGCMEKQGRDVSQTGILGW